MLATQLVEAVKRQLECVHTLRKRPFMVQKRSMIHGNLDGAHLCLWHSMIIWVAVDTDCCYIQLAIYSFMTHC